MASPSGSEPFEATLDSRKKNNEALSVIVRHTLAAVSGEMPAEEASPTMNIVKRPSSPTPAPISAPHFRPPRVDLLADLGDFLNRHSILLTHFTEHVLQGPHISRINEEIHKRAYEETTMTDLQAIAAEDMNFTRLRKIRDLTAQFSRDVQAVWHPESVVPDVSPSAQSYPSPGSDSRSVPASRSLSFSLEGDFKGLKAGKLVLHKNEQAEDHSPQANAPGSDRSDVKDEDDDAGAEFDEGEDDGDDDDDEDEYDDEEFQQIDMNALRQRGKGSYFCPKGRHCDKGGVDKEGNIVRFDRNSSFIQHCNKHRRPWRCELPGCPNPPKKRKFARRDGLERHKLTVKHFVAA
jgi:hypothetical protein